MEIQRLEAGEEKRLKKIRLAALKEAPDAFNSTFKKTADRPKESWVAQIKILPTFVAVVEGEDCGIVRTVPDPQKAGVAHLISMWVAPQARGKGVGEALIDAVISYARSEGYSRLRLDVNDRNIVVIALYRRKGVKATGITGNFSPPRQHIQESEMALELSLSSAI